jgi:hypothetical protein
MVAHPLDPLSPTEFQSTAAILRRDQGVTGSWRFAPVAPGPVLMAILRVRQPAFFRGETLRHESARDMRPNEHLVS